MFNLQKIVQLLEQELIPATIACISKKFKALRLDNKITICLKPDHNIDSLDVMKVSEHRYELSYNPDMFYEEEDGSIDPCGFRESEGFDEYLFTYDNYNKRHMEYYKQMVAKVGMKICLMNALSADTYNDLPQWFVLGICEAAGGAANALKNDEGQYDYKNEHIIKEIYTNLNKTNAYLAVMRIGYLYKCDSNESVITIINRGLNILLNNLRDDIIVRKQIQDLHDFVDGIVYQDIPMYVGDKTFLKRLVEEAGDGAGVFSILSSSPNANGDQIIDNSEVPAAKKRITFIEME